MEPGSLVCGSHFVLLGQPALSERNWRSQPLMSMSLHLDTVDVQSFEITCPTCCKNSGGKGVWPEDGVGPDTWSRCKVHCGCCRLVEGGTFGLCAEPQSRWCTDESCRSASPDPLCILSSLFMPLDLAY